METLFAKKTGVILTLLIFTLVFSNVIPVYAENGIDVTPNLENSPLGNLTFTTPSEDLSKWELTTDVSENAENISHLKLETQICIYDPILCHAPQTIDMTSENNISWTASITTLEKHSYVNWRIHIIYENESELLIPERSDGYAKVWSTCWEIMENQTIINNFDEVTCDEEINSLEENISGFPVITALFSFALATSFIRRNQ